MAKKPGNPKPKPTGRTQARQSNVSAYPLTPEQLVRGIFQISPEDVKKVIASKPGKKK